MSGKQGGRTVEIQRLIGRSLRAGVDLKLLGERQVIVDCDVVRADGGTRCAAITGGYVALAIAINTLRRQGRLNRDPLSTAIAAVSVGIVRGAPVLDLDYVEDSGARSTAISSARVMGRSSRSRRPPKANHSTGGISSSCSISPISVWRHSLRLSARPFAPLRPLDVLTYQLWPKLQECRAQAIHSRRDPMPILT